MLKAELAKRQEDTELFDGDNPGAAEEEEEDGEGEEDGELPMLLVRSLISVW